MNVYEYFVLVLWVLLTSGYGTVLTSSGSGNSGIFPITQIIPECPVGETCTIDQNCKAPDGKNYCVKDVLIKDCLSVGQTMCTLYNGTTGCASSCDSIPECKDLSDEVPCNKYKCKATWRMVYEHDSNGNSIAGSKSDLMNDIRKGAEVKISREDKYVDHVDSLLIVGNEICGKSILSVATMLSDWKTYWFFTSGCTTGDFSKSRWYVGGRTNRLDNTEKHRLKWFTRVVEDKHLTDIPATGRDIEAHIEAVKQSAYGVTVQQVFAYIEEYYRADNLEVSSNDKTIVAQIVWNLLHEISSNVVKISPSGTWLFHNFGSNGKVEASKYLVGENKRSQIDSSEKSSKWFFDPCWRLAYSHDQNGIGVEGSKQELVNAVKAGHRVKVMLKNRLSQASNVIVNGDIVTAFLPDMLKKSTIESLEDPIFSDGKWDWKLVNTNGKVETANYLVGKGQGSVSSRTASMKWFIDRREWKMVLDVGPTNVNSGSKDHLGNEIKEGADVRYAFLSYKCGEYNFVEADSNFVEGNNKNDFSAQHIRSVLLKPNGYEYQFDVTSERLTWLFTITTTSGVVRSRKLVVGEHVSRGVTTTNKRVIWFVAK